MREDAETEIKVSQNLTNFNFFKQKSHKKEKGNSVSLPQANIHKNPNLIIYIFLVTCTSNPRVARL